jgi:hypothetical protein
MEPSLELRRSCHEALSASLRCDARNSMLRDVDFSTGESAQSVTAPEPTKARREGRGQALVENAEEQVVNLRGNARMTGLKLAVLPSATARFLTLQNE